MSITEEIKKYLTETIGAEKATEVVESLDKFVSAFKEQAEKDKKLAVEEAKNEMKVTLEAQYVQKFEDHTKEAEAKLTKEMEEFEVELAKRAKNIIESGIAKHGERMAAVIKESEQGKSSKVLKSIQDVIEQARTEIKESEQSVVKVKELEAQVATLTESVAAEKKGRLEATARKNVAEQNLKVIKEELEAKIQVTISESEKGKSKAKPASEVVTEEEKKAEDKKVVAEQDNQSKAKYSPEALRMRKLAGIG